MNSTDQLGDREALDAAYEDLLRCAKNLEHYIGGIVSDLEQGTYTPDTALVNLEELLFEEDMDLEECLIEVLDRAGEIRRRQLEILK